MTMRRSRRSATSSITRFAKVNRITFPMRRPKTFNEPRIEFSMSYALWGIDKLIPSECEWSPCRRAPMQRQSPRAILLTPQFETGAAFFEKSDVVEY